MEGVRQDPDYEWFGEKAKRVGVCYRGNVRREQEKQIRS